MNDENMLNKKLSLCLEQIRSSILWLHNQGFSLWRQQGNFVQKKAQDSQIPWSSIVQIEFKCSLKDDMYVVFIETDEIKILNSL